MSKRDIGELIEALGNIPAVLHNAAPHDKAQLYSQLGLHLTYEPAQRLIRAETRLNPHSWGYGSCPRGDLRTNHPPRPRRQVMLGFVIRAVGLRRSDGRAALICLFGLVVSCCVLTRLDV